MIKKLITSILITAFSICGCGQHQNSSNKPNIVILQADDLGWDDLPLNGNKFVETPGLDILAEQSIEIGRFYVNPVCAPTRASLLTGRDFLLTGVSHVHGGKDFINLEEKTFGDIFKAEGYTTGIWGKWHSGKTEGYFPWQRGFDEAYMAQLYKHKDSEGLLNGIHVTSNKWTDEVIVDYAVDFIKKNRNKPFVAYLSFLTCHAPLVAKEDLVNKFMKMGLSENLSKLYAMIEQMDMEILRFLNELEDLGLQENTIVIFMSDNGPAIINNWLSDDDRKIRYASKYKGHKGNIWENGVKSPLLFSYPKLLDQKKVDLLSDVTDILPTLADFAEIDISKHDVDLTGKSFAKNLLEENYSRLEKFVFNYADHGWPPTELVWTPRGLKNEYAPLTKNPKLKKYDSQIISLITDEYKLLKNPSPKEAENIDEYGYMLISTKDDPYETVNLSNDKPKEFQKLKKKLRQKYSEIAEYEKSFQPITFYLKKNAEKKVLLYAPIEVGGGIKIASSYSYPWNNVGDYATYRIYSEVEQSLKPSIKVNGDSSGLKLQLQIADKISESVAIKNNRIEFHQINIPKGNSVIKISVVSSSKEEEIQFQELILK